MPSSNDKYGTLRYSMDMSNPDAVAMSKSFESFLRQVVSQFQSESDKVLRTQRSIQGNIRITDYFVPSQHLPIIKKTVEEEFARVSDRRRKSSLGIDISSASDNGFRVHTSNIHDPRTRAEIANLVRQNGGYFSQGKGSAVEWGIGTSINFDDKNLNRVIWGKISNSEQKYKKTLGEVLVNGGAEGDIGDVSLSDERSIAYAALARRSRMVGYKKQYAKEHPDDDAIKEESGGTSGKMGKYVLSGISTEIGLLVAKMTATVVLLGKIREGIVDIVSNARRQALGDQRYNFAPGTMQSWEKIASSKGYDKNMFPGAIGAIMSNFASPLAFDNAPWNKLAPILGIDTAKLVDMVKAGGDQNALGVFDIMIKSIVKSSEAGIAPGLPVTTPDKAYAVNAGLFTEALGGQAGDTLYNYWYEKRDKVGSGNYMPPSDFYTNNPDVPKSLLTPPATTHADVETGNRFRGAGTSIMSVAETLLRQIVGNTGQWIEDFRGWIARSEIAKRFFPSWVEHEELRNVASNLDANRLAGVNAPVERAALAKKLALYGAAPGWEDRPDELQSLIRSQDYKKIGMTFENFAKAITDADFFGDIGAYSDTLRAIRDLGTATTKDGTRLVVYTNATHANDSLSQASMTMGILGQMQVTALVAAAILAQNKKDLESLPGHKPVYLDPAVEAYLDANALRSANGAGDTPAGRKMRSDLQERLISSADVYELIGKVGLDLASNKSLGVTSLIDAISKGYQVEFNKIGAPGAGGTFQVIVDLMDHGKILAQTELNDQDAGNLVRSFTINRDNENNIINAALGGFNLQKASSK